MQHIKTITKLFYCSSVDKTDPQANNVNLQWSKLSLCNVFDKSV